MPSKNKRYIPTPENLKQFASNLMADDKYENKNYLNKINNMSFGELKNYYDSILNLAAEFDKVKTKLLKQEKTDIGKCLRFAFCAIGDWENSNSKKKRKFGDFSKDDEAQFKITAYKKALDYFNYEEKNKFNKGIKADIVSLIATLRRSLNDKIEPEIESENEMEKLDKIITEKNNTEGQNRSISKRFKRKEKPQTQQENNRGNKILSSSEKSSNFSGIDDKDSQNSDVNKEKFTKEMLVADEILKKTCEELRDVISQKQKLFEELYNEYSTFKSKFEQKFGDNLLEKGINFRDFYAEKKAFFSRKTPGNSTEELQDTIEILKKLQVEAENLGIFIVEARLYNESIKSSIKIFLIKTIREKVRNSDKVSGKHSNYNNQITFFSDSYQDLEDQSLDALYEIFDKQQKFEETLETDVEEISDKEKKQITKQITKQRIK